MKESISKFSFPESEEEATQRAENIASRLEETVGGKWKPRYWLNGNHCYDVSLGSISVSEYFRNGEASFSALINSTKGKPGSGLAAWTISESKFPTPEEAVLFAMKNAQDYVDGLQDTLKLNQDLIGPIKEEYKNLYKSALAEETKKDKIGEDDEVICVSCNNPISAKDINNHLYMKIKEGGLIHWNCDLCY